MRIAVDARELCGKPTGVGRYLSELLHEWSGSADGRRHEWIAYRPHASEAVPGALRAASRVLPGGGGTAWEQWTLPRALAADRPDVLFAPAYSAPLTAPCPVVLVVHDLSFYARPGDFHAREGLRRRLVTAWSARRARIVLTDSAFSRDEIHRHLRLAPDRVRVVPLGVRPAAATTAPREPLVLYVGSIFPRRHVDALVAAFANGVARRHPAARLEIVGENRLPRHAPLDGPDAWPPDVRGRIRFRDYVDEATLEDLYARATVFAFLSEYEGFGLTPLEALARGVAPLVLETPIAREVYGDAARYVAPGPGLEARVAADLDVLLGDDAARAAILRHAPDRLARYDWSRTARETLQALEDAAR